MYNAAFAKEPILMLTNQFCKALRLCVKSHPESKLIELAFLSSIREQCYIRITLFIVSRISLANLAGRSPEFRIVQLMRLTVYPPGLQKRATSNAIFLLITGNK